jgi:PAB-dependent poly(A)-specific ribonuclease subunit 2
MPSVLGAKAVSTNGTTSKQLRSFGFSFPPLISAAFRSATRDSLTTFTLHPTTPNTLVLAQPSPELLLLNSATGHLTRSGITAPSLISHLKSSSSLLISGSSDGFLRTHDLRANTRREEGAIEGSALAHVGGLQGLEVSGNSVYTIGWGLR